MGSSLEEKKARESNQITVEKFFQLHGPARAELFAEDGVKELPYAFSDGPDFRWEGKANVKANFEANVDFFPDWKWQNLKIYSTQDPNQFWAEADGSGMINIIGHPKSPYRNHYVFSFKMQDGLIKEFREFNNPLEIMKSLGVPLPKMENPRATEQKRREQLKQ
jgi:phenazine biosynthesis protein